MSKGIFYTLARSPRWISSPCYALIRYFKNTKIYCYLGYHDWHYNDLQLERFCFKCEKRQRALTTCMRGKFCKGSDYVNKERLNE